MAKLLNPIWWPDSVQVLVFDERIESIRSALYTALHTDKKYVFVRINSDRHSVLDRDLTIDFVCFGKSVVDALASRQHVTTTADLYEVLARRAGIVPPLMFLARNRVPLPHNLPKHVARKLAIES